jgi:hypothetical protein
MATKKKSNTHNSATKKRSASKRSTLPASSKRTKKTASKRAQTTTKSKKEAERLSRQELAELTLKAFQMTYDDYQQGKFHRIM